MSESPTESVHAKLRRELAELIVSWGIGWSLDQIIHVRKGRSGMNDVMTVIANAQHGCALHIATASGKRNDEGLDLETEIAITTICNSYSDEASDQEELMWEALCGHLHNYAEENGYAYRYTMEDWTETIIESDGTTYLGRMTTFRRTLVLPCDN